MEEERLVPLYLKVRRGIKERLRRLARERGMYLADLAGELLELVVHDGPLGVGVGVGGGLFGQLLHADQQIVHDGHGAFGRL